MGTVDVEDVRRRADAAGEELTREVNVSVLRPEEWENPSSGFVRHVRTSPLVALDLTTEPVEDRVRP